MNSTITKRAALSIAGALAVTVLGPAGAASAIPVWCETLAQHDCTTSEDALQRPAITVEKKDPVAMAQQHKQARMAFQLQGPPLVTAEAPAESEDSEDPATTAERHRQARMAFVMQ